MSTITELDCSSGTATEVFKQFVESVLDGTSCLRQQRKDSDRVRLIEAIYRSAELGQKSRWKRRERADPRQHMGAAEDSDSRYRLERIPARTRGGTLSSVYPDGIHGAIAEGLGASTDLTVRTATLDEPDNGLAEDVLMDTDVLIWWGTRRMKRRRDGQSSSGSSASRHGAGRPPLGTPFEDLQAAHGNLLQSSGASRTSPHLGRRPRIQLRRA